MAEIAMAHIAMAHIRERTYVTVTVAYGTCTMPIWITTTCPNTLIVTLGDVLESGNAKTASISFALGVETRCYAELKMPFSDVCK